MAKKIKSIYNLMIKLNDDMSLQSVSCEAVATDGNGYDKVVKYLKDVSELGDPEVAAALLVAKSAKDAIESAENLVKLPDPKEGDL